MNKIRVIDLLNKIANGEEVPEEIKYKDTLYNYEKGYKDYREIGTTDFLFEEIFKVNVMPDIILNTEIKIIEEYKKIKKIPLPSFEEFKNMSAEERYLITAKEYDLLDELIEEIEKLKGKSE